MCVHVVGILPDRGTILCLPSRWRAMAIVEQNHVVHFHVCVCKGEGAVGEWGLLRGKRLGDERSVAFTKPLIVIRYSCITV